jgi:glycosyltransferase involved in cell wall biosynthesis
VGLPRTARRARIDVLHAPAYTAPFWSPAPVVLTIHDVSYARRPEWYPYRRDPLRRAFYRHGAQAASAILTVSSFSAAEIQAAYGVPATRISVVPHGVDPAFSPDEDIHPDDLPARVMPPFVLHVGDLHPRRNLAVALDAVLDARRHFGAAAALSLVLAGVDRGIGPELCAIAERAGAPDALVLLGPVEERALRALYRRAAALVYPSLYEGFGLPVLEAMASGTPVIASRAASMPEVAGDAAILLDPHDGRAWADAVTRVVNDDDLRGDLQRRGLRRAATMTWERAARETLVVYRRVAREKAQSPKPGFLVVV